MIWILMYFKQPVMSEVMGSTCFLVNIYTGLKMQVVFLGSFKSLQTYDLSRKGLSRSEETLIYTKTTFSRVQWPWTHKLKGPGESSVMVTNHYFCHRKVVNLSRIILLPMVSRARRKIIWRFRVVGITSPTAKQMFATWKTRWWISFQFSHAVSLKGTRVAFFKSGIKPSGVTVSGLIAVVFILETPAMREGKK